MAQNPYQIAWNLLKRRLDQKIGWGKLEIRDEMKSCLVEAFEQIYKDNEDSKNEAL